jgi:hypothetical protein
MTTDAAVPRPTLRPGRLIRLHLASRGVATGLLMLAGCAIVLRIVLHWATPGSDAARPVPLLIEAGAAAIIGVLSRSPFGEPEHATGRWLPFLRLGTAVALSTAAFGILAAGSAAAHLDLGYLEMARDLAGMTGIALLAAAITGANLSWIGPISFWLLAVFAIGNNWTTPWIWPDRQPHDRGAAICAALVFTAGAALMMMRGARDSAHE